MSLADIDIKSYNRPVSNVYDAYPMGNNAYGEGESSLEDTAKAALGGKHVLIEKSKRKQERKHMKS